MNNDNEIMKEFNETFGNKPEPTVEPYHTVQNQNVNVVNDFNNVQNNSSQNVTMSSFINQNPSVNIVSEINNTVIVENSTNNINANNNIENNNVNTKDNIQGNNDYQLYNTTNYINDSNKPIEKKVKKNTININPELKTAILLAIVLLVAMSFIPTLFDLFDSLKLKIFR